MDDKKSKSASYNLSWRKYYFQTFSKLRLTEVEQAFSQFLSPHPLVQTSGRKLNEPLLGVIAQWQGKPVGLVLVEKRDSQNGLVVCWNVIKSHHNHGLGRELIEQIELFSKSNDINKLTLSFRWDTPFRPQISKTLQHLGWQSPKQELMLYKFSPAIFMQMPWCQTMHLPSKLEIFSWKTLSSQDKHHILDRQKQSNWYPVEYAPLFDGPEFEPATSIGLRLQGEVVGWLITHQVSADVIEYSSLFVSLELQGLGRGIHLIVEAVKRQHAHKVAHAIFQVQVKNTQMISFVGRRMSETIISQTSRWYSEKSL